MLTPRLLTGAILLLAVAVGAPAAQAQVSVFPTPGSRYSMPTTQITFRGVAPGQIGSISVTGSTSGVHAGRLVADSDGNGASFIPAVPFTRRETVTVTTGLDVPGGSGGTFSFQIATPAAPIVAAPLPQAPAGANGLQHFRSRPDLLPPSITVTKNSAPASDGDVFVAPQFGPAQDGPMIFDPSGNLVWFRPKPLSSKTLTTDFRAQTLYGQPVLTWWQGYINSGSGRGVGVIVDRNYQVRQVVQAGNGLQMDLHEFLITPDGQAYVLAASPVWLPGLKRPVMDSVVQEVDLRSGLVLFSWHALDHIALSESYVFGAKVAGHILDPYHVNSIALDRDGNLILSARNTSAVYKIDRNSGAIIWRLGGKHSSFTMGRGTSTAFQHNAVVQPDGTITIFDDGAGPPKVHPASRGVRVALNLTNMSATLVHEYDHSPATSAAFEGGVQALPSGDAFLGWGQQPYMSEYAPNGQQDFDARFIAFTSSYRAYRFPWHAQPQTTPALALTSAADGTITPYASWNGATDVAGWRVLAGDSASRLAAVRSAPKHKFESAIPIHSGDPDFAVQALSSSGRVLATSRTTSAPPHLAIYGHSAFVSPSALGGVPVSCLSPHPCSITTTVSAARTLLARSGRERLAANSGGILYFRLSPAARRMLAHARNHRLAVQLTAQDGSGLRTSTRLNLIPFAVSGSGPHRSLAPSLPLRVVGASDFVSPTGVGGVLAECQAPRTCTVRMTVSAGSAVIARTGPETLGARELGYVAFSLTSAGRTLLARAAGHQLGAHVAITDGHANAQADIALLPFR